MQSLDFSICCGCKSCQRSCPKNAIELCSDAFGAKSIRISCESCINCGLCQKRCPMINPSLNGVLTSYLCYSKNRSIRKNGSSGGFFGLLATQLISEGWLICGAAWNGLRVVHKIIDRVEDLPSIQKSKYVQSELGDVFPQIKSFLSANKKMVFVGTPCQVESLKKYLGNKNDDNLLLIDFLCHGVPSQQMFDRFISNEESKKNIKIRTFSFRSKSHGNPHSFAYTYFKKGSKRLHKRTGNFYEFPYYQAYLSYTLFMESCYHCPFSQEKRPGDLTLADGWMAETLNSKFSTWGRGKGVSEILVNTSKGQRAFSCVQRKLIVSLIPTDFVKKNNQSFKEPTILPEDYLKKVRLQTSTDFEKSIKTNFTLSKRQLFKARLSDAAPRWLVKFIRKLSRKA